jgi:anhydro-N-acetylmuramic acid kinase
MSVDKNKIFIGFLREMTSHSTSQTILGLMSGTSLDGLDLALCRFSDEGFEILRTASVPYSPYWHGKLSNAIHLSGEELMHLDAEYGKWLGQEAKLFLDQIPEKIDAVASHGHTIFHQPQNGFSTQIGSGAHIAAQCKLPVVCDFRSLDVALGGQGAPLVPIGDALLFHEFDLCLNLGGIANISGNVDGKRIAFDICPVNMMLNHLAEKEGLRYDKDGLMAASGNCIPELLEELNHLAFYAQNPPKSLGREWFLHQFLPIVERQHASNAELMHTVCVHIAHQIVNATKLFEGKTMLSTGGGTHHLFLMEKMKEAFPGEVIIPKEAIIDFKEAIIFAFLGYLRLNGRTNALSSVTGASLDSCSGAVYLPPAAC